MRPEQILEKVELPQGVQATVESNVVKVTGPKGEVEKDLKSPRVDVLKQDNAIIIQSKKPTKREKTLVFTFKAHIRNMLKGVAEGHRYVLKICSGHFPMNVSVSNNEFVVKNSPQRHSDIPDTG